MNTDAKVNRMRVHVVDQDGRVWCERGGQRLEGALATNLIRPSVPVRLAVGAAGEEGSLEIVGLPTTEQALSVCRGLAFEIDVKRVTRATISPDPFAPSATHAALHRSVDGPHVADVPSEGPTLPTSSPMQTKEFAKAFGEMESEPSGVYGSLRGMSLPEVLQSLEHGRRDATVLVRPKGGSCGVLRVQGGQVIFAEQGARLGEDAFFHLAATTRGSFLIRFDADCPEAMEPNIDQHLHWLLLETARRSDERQNQAEELPASDLKSALESAAVRLGESEIRRRDELQAELVAEDGRDPQAFADAAMAEAFDATETRPALFSQFFTEADPPGTSVGAPISSLGALSAIELDEELERSRNDDDRGPSGWTGSYSTPSVS